MIMVGVPPLAWLVALLAIGASGISRCFPNPSSRCRIQGNNLILTYKEVHTEYFCAERCLDFEDCLWWTYNDYPHNTCDLFRKSCEPTPSKYSRYDARCSSQDNATPVVTLLIGGTTPSGDPIKEVEVFDYIGPCEAARFIKGPIPLESVPWKHSTSFIPYLNTVVSCGGNSLGDSSSRDCLLYDFNKLQWYKNTSILPGMQKGRVDFSLVYAYGEIYAMGGIEGEEEEGLSLPYSSMEIYSPLRRVWRRGAPLPKGLYRHCALKVRESIYVMGGQDSPKGIPERLMIRYNVTNGEWKRLMSMNIGRIHHACEYNPTRDEIIVSGGMSSIMGKHMETISVYDLRSGIWKDEKIHGENKASARRHFPMDNEIVYNQSNQIQRNSSKGVGLLRYRKDFSWINIPEDMLVVGCHVN